MHTCIDNHHSVSTSKSLKYLIGNSHVAPAILLANAAKITKQVSIVIYTVQIIQLTFCLSCIQACCFKCIKIITLSPYL